MPYTTIVPLIQSLFLQQIVNAPCYWLCEILVLLFCTEEKNRQMVKSSPFSFEQIGG